MRFQVVLAEEKLNKVLASGQIERAKTIGIANFRSWLQITQWSKIKSLRDLPNRDWQVLFSPVVYRTNHLPRQSSGLGARDELKESVAKRKIVLPVLPERDTLVSR